MPESLRVLYVEDNEADAVYFRFIAEQDDLIKLDIRHVTRLSEALKALEEGKTDLVLLDLTLPDSKELESVKKISERFPSVPIVILSGMQDEELAIKAIRAGAQEYL